MEAVAAVSLAGNILQFISFGVDLLSRSKKIYRADQNTAIGSIEVKAIVSEVTKGVHVIKAHPSVAAAEFHSILKEHCDSCLEIADELLVLLNRVQVNGQHRKWKSLKAALVGMSTQSKVQSLEHRFRTLKQDVISYFITSKLLEVKDSIERGSSQHEAMLRGLNKRIETVLLLQSNKPKDIGYPWEAGEMAQHLCVDDGLDPAFFMPRSLCLTYQDFNHFLSFKFRKRHLPGRFQISNGHIQLYNWAETSVLDDKNWSFELQNDKGVKVAFVMGSWHGFRKRKCIRCLKPLNGPLHGQTHRKCSSCNLEVRSVAPDAFPYEPEDISLDSRTYMSYRKFAYSRGEWIKLMKTINKTMSYRLEARSKPNNREIMTETPPEENTKIDPPAIELVCHRLIVKWEPIYNIIHRYIYCRCALRLSTPSRITEELTILVAAPCPRHNDCGISHRDYGNINYETDPYFDRFGGYDAFRGLVWHTLSEQGYEHIGGEAFLPTDQIESALDTLCRKFNDRHEDMAALAKEYKFEVQNELDKVGAPLHKSVVDYVKAERARRQYS